jgi:hypothetical protein
VIEGVRCRRAGRLAGIKVSFVKLTRFEESLTAMDATKPGVAGMFARAVAALLVLASPAALYAQSCAMCYQSAAASGQRSIHALKLGILILMVPPLLITAGVTYLAYRKRDEFNQNS